jgi:peroxidase
MAEDHLPGSTLGPLTHAILTSQFSRLRDGDRFFFTGDPDLQSDLVRAVVDLDSITLSQIIRLNSGITSLPSNVFLTVPEPTSACALLALAATLVMLRLRTEVVRFRRPNLRS